MALRFSGGLFYVWSFNAFFSPFTDIIELSSDSSCSMSISRLTAREGVFLRVSISIATSGSGGNPLAGASTLQPAGSPIAVRMVIPGPACAAAHIPATARAKLSRSTASTKVRNKSNSSRSVVHHLLYIRITARGGRTVEQKQALYKSIVTCIAAATPVSADDVVIILLENDLAGWSFGGDIAQMVEKEIPTP